MGRAIVVIGSGVTGLTIAYLLATGPDPPAVRIVAKDLVGDMDSQGWASPWAGANWSPMTFDNPRAAKWEADTLRKFREMIPEGRTMALPTLAYHPDQSALEKSWYKDAVLDYRTLADEELISGMKAGESFVSISVQPKTYLDWLKEELLKHNVEFIRRRLTSIEEAVNFFPDAGNLVIVNATGLGARSLIGVEDKAVYPIRGQTILVEAPSVKRCAMSLGDPVAYVIPRMDGTSILGGTYHQGSWDLSVDYDDAARIHAQCASLVPELKEARVISHNVGLRPARKGGARVEKEIIQLPLSNGSRVSSKLAPLVPSQPRDYLNVVHAYGIGAAGYQSSWGLAMEAVSLVNEFFLGKE